MGLCSVPLLFNHFAREEAIMISGRGGMIEVAPCTSHGRKEKLLYCGST